MVRRSDLCVCGREEHCFLQLFTDVHTRRTGHLQTVLFFFAHTWRVCEQQAWCLFYLLFGFCSRLIGEKAS